MPTTHTDDDIIVVESSSNKSRTRGRKRKLNSPSVVEIPIQNAQKKQKRSSSNTRKYVKYYKTTRKSLYGSGGKDKVVIEGKVAWKKVKSHFQKNSETDSESKVVPKVTETALSPNTVTDKCWIEELPQEILLKIFSYLPLGMLLHTIPQVCKKWETLALDWTLWKAVEDLTIKNMVISTSKLRTLLRTIPKLKKLELILRNDTEELLHELFETHQNLEVLKLDRCYRSTLQMNILSQTVISILESCPKLKTVMLTDTYFHSKNFYKCLAKKFRNIERISVTCTTKSEMDVFMDNLMKNIPEVEFQMVPMMGRADGKQIYWGPILGLVVRPIPTSPFHQQYMHDNYPNYAF